MLSTYIQKLVHYHYWANHRIWPYVLQLTETQFTQPSDYSIGSVKDQLVHMLWAEEIWLNRISGIDERPTYEPEDFPDAASIQAHWDKIEQRMLHWVDNATEADLTQTFSYTNAQNQRFENTVLDTLTHVVNHGTDHRAQILALMHRLGAETLSQDMILFYRG